MKVNSCIMVLLMATAVVGCRWHSRDLVHHAVWSDDDTSHAVVRVRYEEKEKASPYSNTAAARRNFRHQIYLQAPDGSNRQALLPERSSVPGNDLYYMKQAGYVLISIVEGNSLRFEKVTLAGEVTMVATTDAASAACGYAAVIPSPSGSMLARIERRPVSAAAPCGAGEVHVVMLRASDLATLTMATWQVDGMVDATWNPEERLFVSTGSQAWEYSMGAIPTSLPGCMHPKTTSSNISNAGVPLLLEPSDEALPLLPAFGCQ